MPRSRSHTPAPSRRLTLAALALVALALIAGALAWLTRDQGRIFPGVTVAGVRAGGMTPQAAGAALRGRAAHLAHETVALRTGDRDWILPAAALGISYDADAAARDAYALGRRGWPGRRLVERLWILRRGARLLLAVRLDESRARAALSAIAWKLGRGPRDASARLVNGTVEIIPGVPGGHLDLPRSLSALRAWLHAGHHAPLVLPARVRAPQVKQADLRGINGVVAQFSTTLGGSSRNRVHNVALAAQAVDGLVIMPHQKFAYNTVVGPRTEEAGYRTAPVLRHGELVPGTGGGACQVSSTLYNVALLGNLKIMRRTHHSRPVHYVRPGLDATVAYGSLDLIFRNTTDGPIVLNAGVSRRRLWIKALGRTPCPEVRIERSSRRLPPGDPIERPDSSLPAGERVLEHKAEPGLRVMVTRITGRGAGATREVISNDTYRPTPAVIRVGTRPAPPGEAPASPGAAKKPEKIAE